VNRQIGVRKFKCGVTGEPLFTGREGGHEFWDLYISGTVGARNFKFGMHRPIDHQRY